MSILKDQIFDTLDAGFEVLFHKDSVGNIMVRVSDFNEDPSRHIERGATRKQIEMSKVCVLSAEVEAGRERLSK